MPQMWKRLHVKYPLFLLDFNETWIFSTGCRKKGSNIEFSRQVVGKRLKYWIFSTGCRKKAQILNVSNMRPVGAELFFADGQTDMTKLIVTFRNLENAPKT